MRQSRTGVRYVRFSIPSVPGSDLMFFILFLQSFGEVREFEWASNGSLYVDFKKTSVAETVSFPSIVLGFLVLDLLSIYR